MAKVPQVLNDNFKPFDQRDPLYTQLPSSSSTLITMTGRLTYAGAHWSYIELSMKVTDLNPDAKWAIATSVITTFQRYNDPWKPWAYATGLSYLYDTGYGCINGSPGYAPGYWHKKNPNDLKIWYS